MTYTHEIVVHRSMIYRIEIKSESDTIDAMSYAMELMSDADRGDNENLVDDQMTWDHFCNDELCQ